MKPECVWEIGGQFKEKLELFTKQWSNKSKSKIRKKSYSNATVDIIKTDRDGYVEKCFHIKIGCHLSPWESELVFWHEMGHMYSLFFLKGRGTVYYKKNHPILKNTRTSWAEEPFAWKYGLDMAKSQGIYFSKELRKNAINRLKTYFLDMNEKEFNKIIKLSGLLEDLK